MSTPEDFPLQPDKDGITRLPDGSGFFTASFPLPADHWLTADAGPIDIPPMRFRMGADDPRRKPLERIIREAGKYAYRAASMRGTLDEIDPDALLQNLVVAFCGYHTDDGLSASFPESNPSKPPPLYAGGIPDSPDKLPYWAWYTEEGRLVCKCAVCGKVYDSFVEASELIDAKIEGSYCRGSLSCCP
jgi:hypothetical protein